MSHPPHSPPDPPGFERRLPPGPPGSGERWEEPEPAAADPPVVAGSRPMAESGSPPAGSRHPSSPSVHADGRPGGADPSPGLLPSPERSADGEVMDQLSRHLAQAGFRLARLRHRLQAMEDQIMADQVSSELDEAIAQVRRLALAMRRTP